MAARKPVRWHIAVFLAPAVAVYTALMLSLIHISEPTRPY